MLGAIAGDIIGSRFERNNLKSKDFELFDPSCRFTDDTVLTIAIADAILNDISYETCVRQYAIKHPFAGYGGTFKKWMFGLMAGPYNSWGNGSAMRVSPIGFAYDAVEGVLEEAKRSAEITHNHPEGVKGAQAVALAIWLARQGRSKREIKTDLEARFDYDLSRTLDAIRPDYQFDVSCQGSVPEAIIAFLESTDLEDAIRNAISIGGDSDTIACIAGGIAEAFYGTVPETIRAQVRSRLPEPFLQVMDAFYKAFFNEE
ncbi:MAG: ADP-ribosylglycohydrolase family protein [Bacteroidota bacterium]